MLILALVLVLIGIALGGAGMRKLGRFTRRINGPWRPGIGMGAILALFAAAALAVRGAWGVSILLGLAGGVLALTARGRPLGKAAAKSPQPKMTEAEARALLGLPPGADAEAVQAAYLRLMKMAHPDQGGTTGLAVQLNAARARLIGG